MMQMKTQNGGVDKMESNCCGAEVTETELHDGFGRCSKCKEHCEVVNPEVEERIF
jgi:hypothetical protein